MNGLSEKYNGKQMQFLKMYNAYWIDIAYSIIKDKDTVTVVIWNTIWDRTLSTNNK